MLSVPGMVGRFVREARAASKIKSAHVVRVTDVDVLPSGVPYMVMEYLEGESLAEIRRRRGRLEVEEATQFLLQACDAIAEAHALGIVHRDIKPANLFLTRRSDGSQRIKVLDFGISKIEGPNEMEATQVGQVMGSPKYMAPEQMLSMHDVDGRADIWSLGAILYELVVGRAPFLADTAARVCALVLHAPPAAPRTLNPDLPAELEAVILRCLERDPAKRYPIVGDLMEALRPFAPEGTLPPLSGSRGAHALLEDGGRDSREPGAGSTPLHPVSFTFGGVASTANQRGTLLVAASVTAAALLIVAAGFALRWGLAAPVAPLPLPTAATEATAASPPAVPAVAVVPAAPPATTAVPDVEPGARRAPHRARLLAAPKAAPPPKAAQEPGASDPFGGKRR